MSENLCGVESLPGADMLPKPSKILIVLKAFINIVLGLGAYQSCNAIDVRSLPVHIPYDCNMNDIV
jgi:hypothetical protein